MLNELTPELQTLKTKLKTTWSAGDYGLIAKQLEKSAEGFLTRHPIEPGIKVLDVACGTGQLAIPAARAGARSPGDQRPAARLVPGLDPDAGLGAHKTR